MIKPTGGCGRPQLTHISEADDAHLMSWLQSNRLLQPAGIWFSQPVHSSITSVWVNINNILYCYFILVILYWTWLNWDILASIVFFHPNLRDTLLLLIYFGCSYSTYQSLLFFCVWLTDTLINIYCNTCTLYCKLNIVKCFSFLLKSVLDLSKDVLTQWSWVSSLCDYSFFSSYGSIIILLS